MRTFKPGDIVSHFKRNESHTHNEYLYRIVGIAKHTETGQDMMVYETLYEPYGLYVRPYDMFMSEVDKEKYPDVIQKYRFEKVDQ